MSTRATTLSSVRCLISACRTQLTQRTACVRSAKCGGAVAVQGGAAAGAAEQQHFQRDHQLRAKSRLPSRRSLSVFFFSLISLCLLCQSPINLHYEPFTGSFEIDPVMAVVYFVAGLFLAADYVWRVTQSVRVVVQYWTNSYVGEQR